MPLPSRAIRRRTCGEKDCSRCGTARAQSLIRDRAANVDVGPASRARLRRSRWGFDESHVAVADALRRASPGAPRQRLLRQPVRRRRRLRDRRVRRFRQHVDGRRTRTVPRHQDRVFFPHSLGLLYLAITQYLGFHEVRRRVQGDGPGAVRRAVVRRQASPARSRRRRAASFGLDLVLPHWSGEITMTWDDGEPEIGRVYTPKLEALLGPARRPEEPVDAAARGARRLAAARLRGSGVQDAARAARTRAQSDGCAWRAAAR